MRVTKTMAGALLTGLLWPGIVLAQQGEVAPRVRQPESIRRTAFEAEDNVDYYAEAAPAGPQRPSPSPSDEPAAAKPEAAPAAEPEAVSGDDSDKPSGRGSRCCHDGKLEDPWKLFPEFESGLKIGGWVSGGIYGNEHGAHSNGPIGLRDVGDEFTMDQLWLSIDKPTNTKDKDLDWGLHVDYVFGADGPDTRSFGNSPTGWDNAWISSADGVYGSAIPQLYGVLAYKNLSVRLGHFYTLVGYEVVQATGNFLYSHSYAHTYGEPFTHTGALASYALKNDVTLYGGWTTAWDTGFENPTGANLFLGGLSFPIGKKITFAWYTSTGNNGELAGAGLGDLYYNYFGVNYKINDKWNYGFAHDLGLVTNDPGANGQWYGISQYLVRKINDCWSLGGRFEWFHDDDGLRVPNYFGALGNAGDYYELTFGLNWRPHANLIVRPELRYDWYNGAAASGAAPFDNGLARDQFSGGVDFIVTY